MFRLKHILPLMAIAALVGGVQAAPASASANQDAILDATGQLLSNPAGTLQVLRELGVSRIRVAVEWDTIAPSIHSRHAPANFHAINPASYSAARWAPYDRLVQDARQEGIAVYFMLTGPAPRWATGSGQPAGGPHLQWKPNARDYGYFVRAIGTRYSGRYKPRGASSPLPRVSFWTIWNEPNYGPDLAPQATDHDSIEVGAAEYRGLVDAAWGALNASGHGQDTILIGETAPRGLDHPIGNFGGVKPLRFIRALYCVNSSYHELRGSAARARSCPTTAAGSRRFRSQHPGLFKASGFADHPYEQNTPPNQPTTSNPKKFASDPDYADLPEIPRLERMLDRIQGIYGSKTHFNIYSTEYGYRTNPPDPAIHISPTTAAEYMNWAEYLSWRQRRLVSYAQYLLEDPPNHVFASGLESSNGVPKVTFDAYRMPLFLPVTTTNKGSSLEVWGCVRPAHFAQMDSGQQQSVQIQLRSGSGAFQTVETVPITNVRGYFDVHVKFPAGGTVRLQWAYPSGPTVHSRSVAITVHGSSSGGGGGLPLPLAR